MTTRSRTNPSATDADQVAFLALLPKVLTYARLRFRGLPASIREDAFGEVVALAFVAFKRLRARGKDPADFPSDLARFTVLAVWNGRRAGRRSSTGDILSSNWRRRHHFTLIRLDDPIPGEGGWWRDIVYDRRTDVAAQAAFNIDFPAWLATLSPLIRRIAKLLASVLSRKFVHKHA